MSLVFRCGDCSKTMILEPVHRGRTVKCPHCQGKNEVPDHLDFESAAEASLQDLNRGGLLLFFGIAGSVILCVPVPAICWWMSVGAIQRAREEEREVDPTLQWSKWVGIIGTVADLIVLALAGAASFL